MKIIRLFTNHNIRLNFYTNAKKKQKLCKTNRMQNIFKGHVLECQEFHEYQKGFILTH